MGESSINIRFSIAMFDDTGGYHSNNQRMYAIFAVHCSFVWLEGLSEPEMSLALVSDAFHGARIQVMLMSCLLYCLLVICMAMENTYV